MEVKDSTEVPNLKVGARSRSSSKELIKTDEVETSEDASDKLTKNTDSDLPNGAEPHENSKHTPEEEEDPAQNMDTEEVEEAEEEPPGDRGEEDPVAKEVPEHVKDSPAVEETPEEPQGSPAKEDNCDIAVKEESNFDDGGESDSSSESILNIDTSGSSARSEQAGSEREEVGEESEVAKKETTPVGDRDDEEYHSDDSESFLGFVEETSDVHSILKRIIEKLELEDTPSEDDDPPWDSPFDNEDGGSSSQKLAPITNHEDTKTVIAPRWSRKYLKEETLRDRSPGRLDGGNPGDMVASEDVNSSVASSPSLSSGVSSRGKKVHIDLTNPAFRKPMEHGWRRELVYRNTSDASGQKRMADIYYYTPLGKKVRSNREVIENLVGEELTLDNFTFFKEPLGLDDPTKETIRDAKRVATKEPIGAPPKKLAKLSKTASPPKEPPSEDAAAVEPSAKPVVATYKDNLNMSSKESSPAPAAAAPSPKQKPAARAFPRVKVTPLRNQRKSQNAAANSTPNSKSATGGGRSKKDPNTSGELVMGMLPPQWKDPTTTTPTNKKSALLTPGANNATASPQATAGAPTPATTNKAAQRQTTPKMGKKVTSPCSIQCLGMMGIIPSLQCRVCLCLYHPECVGLGRITDTIHCYVCKVRSQGVWMANEAEHQDDSPALQEDVNRNIIL